ncbi:MAG: ATP-binding cassette domain-containing protein [Anaerovoracaceae bacterium]
MELENVRFSYDGSKDVIKGISLSRVGQTVAFVGPSGGGKSTLASLISRFLIRKAEASGSADRHQAIEKEELMNTVSFVFQTAA